MGWNLAWPRGQKRPGDKITETDVWATLRQIQSVQGAQASLLASLNTVYGQNAGRLDVMQEQITAMFVESGQYHDRLVELHDQLVELLAAVRDTIHQAAT